MKKFNLLLVIIFLFLNSFARYGDSFLNNTPPLYELNAPISGAVLEGTNYYGINFTSQRFFSASFPDFDNFVQYNFNNTRITGVDFNSEGKLIGIEDFTPRIYEQDFANSTSVSLGVLSGISLDVYSGLAWDDRNEKLYGIGFDWTGTWGLNTSYLFTIDLNSMTASIIGAIPGVDVCLSLAYDSKNHALYTVNYNTADLIRLDPINANATVVGNIGPGYSNYQTFLESDFNDETGELYLSIYTSSNETEILIANPLNGETTLLSSYAGEGILIAVYTVLPSVPVNWYYFFLIFLIPALIFIKRRIFS